MHVVGKVGEVALCHIGEGQRREVRVAEGQHARSQVEVPIIAADVAQRLERDQ
jgi:hypothetical protein